MSSTNQQLTGVSYNPAKAFVKPSVNLANQSTILGLSPPGS